MTSRPEPSGGVQCFGGGSPRVPCAALRGGLLWLPSAATARAPWALGSGPGVAGLLGTLPR
eukprot:9246702-Lingulodinium_polyedra.AAC.1